MTKQEFDIIAETWYQRTHRLREFSEDETKPPLKRLKARILFFMMFERMQAVIQIAFKLSQPKPPKYPSGGREIIPTP